MGTNELINQYLVTWENAWFLSLTNESSDKYSIDLRPVGFNPSRLLSSISEKPESRGGVGPSSKLSVYGRKLSTLDLPLLTKDMSRLSCLDISYGLPLAALL